MPASGLRLAKTLLQAVPFPANDLDLLECELPLAPGTVDTLAKLVCRCQLRLEPLFKLIDPALLLTRLLLELVPLLVPRPLGLVESCLGRDPGVLRLFLLFA